MERIERISLERLVLFLSLLIPLGLSLRVLPSEQALLVGALILLAILLEIRGHHLPRVIINALGLLTIGYFFLTVTLSELPENLLRTLLLLLALKLFEEKRMRNYFQIYLLELLSLATLSLYYLSILFFGLLLAQLLIICFSLFIHLYFEEGEREALSGRELKDILLSLGALFFTSLLLGSLFFVALPRLESPLLGFGMAGKDRGKTGFSEEIKLGGVSSIQESTRVVLRFTLDEAQPVNANNLYIRILTFEHFDGIAWKRENPAEFRRPNSPSLIPRRAQIYLQEDLEGYLPTIEYTYHLGTSLKVFHSQDGTIRLLEQVSYPLKYEILFNEELSYTQGEAERGLERYLQVPEVSDSLRKLAESLKGGSPLETIEKTLRFLKGGEFRHTLRDLPTGERPLERFLFETKQGNCEFFAGAMVILLRLNGIPARVVGGFRGAIKHPQGNYYLVPEKFAHAWVEALIDRKWVRFDPTPASPIQILQSEKSLLFRLKVYFDLLNFYYMKFIVDYDLQKQRKLLEYVGKFLRTAQREGKSSENFGRFSEYRKVIAYLFAVILVLLLSIVIYRLRDKLRILFNYVSKTELRLLLDFERELAKRGYRREPWEGLYEVAERIPDKAVRDLALKFAETWSRYYYRDLPFDREGLEELRRCLKALKNLN